jgi:hypothetical protein
MLEDPYLTVNGTLSMDPSFSEEEEIEIEELTPPESPDRAKYAIELDLISEISSDEASSKSGSDFSN